MDTELHNDWQNMLSEIGTVKQVKSQETVVYYQETVNTLYVVLQGGLVLLHVNPNSGKERAINFFIPGYHPIATVSESYVYGTPSKYQLKAFTNTKLIALNKQSVERYLHEKGNYETFLNYGIRSLIDKNELRAMLISLTSEEMLKHLYKQSPQVLQNVPSKYIADFLGITPQWLSKLKHKL